MARLRPEPWQVWWAQLDPTMGREQAGRRPVVVVASPLHTQMFGHAVTVVLPLTATERPLPNRVKVVLPGVGPGAGWVITEQPRTISVERLTGRPLRTIDGDARSEIQAALRALIDV